MVITYIPKKRAPISKAQGRLEDKKYGSLNLDFCIDRVYDDKEMKN
jgi:hypothetical protein